MLRQSVKCFAARAAIGSSRARALRCWKFDDKLAAPHLTRETLVGRHAVCPIEQIEFVVAGRHQVLQPLTYHDAAACAASAPAIVCDIDALTEQIV